MTTTIRIPENKPLEQALDSVMQRIEAARRELRRETGLRMTVYDGLCAPCCQTQFGGPR
jgi:hypothetical protein